MSNFLKTRKFNVFKNMAFGFGASVVLIGAWAKLMHYPWAGLALTIGLLTEAVIFAISAIVPPEDHYYWEKLYPGLNEADAKVEPVVASGAGKSVTGELDKMLEKAKIDQSLIDRLGQSMQGLVQTLASCQTLRILQAPSTNFPMRLSLLLTLSMG